MTQGIYSGTKIIQCQITREPPVQVNIQLSVNLKIFIYEYTPLCDIVTRNHFVGYKKQTQNQVRSQFGRIIISCVFIRKSTAAAVYGRIFEYIVAIGLNGPNVAKT